MALFSRLTRVRAAAPLALLAFLGAWALAGCSLDRLAADATAGLLDKASRSFNEEPDPVIARDAIPANLKLLEGLLQLSPDNATLLTNLARGWCSYGFGFLEDSGDRVDLERASALYRRGFGFGVGSFAPHVAMALRGESLADIERSLASVERAQVAPLFWSAYCLGNWVNLNLATVDGVAQLSKVELMMRRVAALDPGFYHGGADLFYGAYYGRRPKLLGGDPDKAKEHLLRAASFSNGRFLMARFFLAEVYAVVAQDQKLFQETLREIIDAPDDLMPEERLANALARRRALRLLARQGELFEPRDGASAGAAETSRGKGEP